jgi:hypothetical protein
MVFRFTEAFFPSHTRVLIIFCTLVSTSFGIPWTVVRYCVIPPANMLTTSLLEISVGCRWSHLTNIACILSRFLDHTAPLSTLLLIQPPSIRVGSRSFAIWISWLRGALPGDVFQVSRNSFLYCGVPIGIISVLLMLNLAPDAQHQSPSMDRSSS